MKRILILFMAFSALAFGQQEGDKSSFYEYGARISADCLVLPDTRTDSSALLIVYKIPNSALAFRKLDEFDETKVVAYPRIVIEIRDTNNIIRRSTEIPDTIVTNISKSKLRDEYTRGIFRCKLMPGQYKAVFRLETANNTMIQKIDFPKIVLNKPNASPAFGTPIMAFADESEDNKLRMWNQSGAIGFSSQRSFIVIPCSFRKDQSFFRYEIKQSRQPDPDRELVWLPPFSATGEIEADANEVIRIDDSKMTNAPLIFSDPFITDGSIVRGNIRLELQYDKIVPGEYSLVLRNVSSKDSSEIKFRIEWENMPFSLRKPEYAADMLYYILTDKQYDEIKSGSKIDIFNNILKYWEKFDPTPGTHFNEAMNAYFSRVDYASLNYNTFSEKDGAKTDRGKIYILYANPTEVIQKSDGKKRFEIWEYKNLCKRIYFELSSNGIYKIAKEEAIPEK